MIELEGVTKRFARKPGIRSLLGGQAAYVTALDSISFRCGTGEIVGVVGPNGAGKTTLSKLIANLILPDQGTIRIAGETARQAGHDFRRRIGFVTCDERSFFWRLTGRQNLEFFLALYEQRSANEALALAEYFEIERKLDVPFAEYSAGMRKRLAIIRGLMVDPEILVFDEATNALDPVCVAKLKRLLTDRCPSKTVLWTTHRLEEITELCTRVLLLQSSRLVFDGSLAALKQRFHRTHRAFSLTVRGDGKRIAALTAEGIELHQVLQENGHFRCTLLDDGRGALLGKVLSLLAATDAELVRFEELEDDIRDIYLALVEGTDVL